MKAGVSYTIPVKLLATWGAYPGTPNVKFDSLTVWISKQDGTTQVKALDATLWTQLQSFNRPGVYHLGFHSHEVNQVGWFSFTIKGAVGVHQEDERFEFLTYADTDIQQREGALQTTADAGFARLGPLQTTGDYVTLRVGPLQTTGDNIMVRMGPLQTSIDALDVSALSNDVSDMRQAILGKQVLKLNMSPPRHIIYEADGVTILQQAEVEDTIEERRYNPL